MPDDTLVAAYSGSRGEALIIEGLLKANGVAATLSDVDPQSVYTGPLNTNHARVLVFASDVERARELIAEAGSS